MEHKEELYYYHNDINGAPLRLTDQQGKVVWNVHYDIMGRIDIPRLKVNEVHNPIRMQGQYEDEETGLYYNRYRYFDPNICAYVSQDPLGLLAGENVYCYPWNSFGYTDPLGLACKMVGENGTQTSSETVWKNGKTERIDVENPNPGKRPGQIHYHEPNNQKWYYDIENKNFYNQETQQLAPKKIQNLLKDSNFKKGIKKGLKYLGEL